MWLQCFSNSLAFSLSWQHFSMSMSFLRGGNKTKISHVCVLNQNQLNIDNPAIFARQFARNRNLIFLPALLLSLCRVCVGFVFRNPKKSFVRESREVEWKEYWGYSWLSVAGWNAPYKVAQPRSLDGIEENLKKHPKNWRTINQPLPVKINLSYNQQLNSHHYLWLPAVFLSISEQHKRVHCGIARLPPTRSQFNLPLTEKIESLPYKGRCTVYLWLRITHSLISALLKYHNDEGDKEMSCVYIRGSVEGPPR